MKNYDRQAECAETESAEWTDRYGILQEIALCLKNGKPVEEKMKNYEKMLKLVDSVGK